MAKYPSYSISSGSARLKYNLSFNLASYGSSKLALGFWMMHDTGYSGANDNVQVQVSTDNLTWTNVGTAVKRYDATAATPTWKLHYVDISAYAAGSTVWIAFLGTSFWGNNIYIDDMSINVPAEVPDAVPANNVLSKTITLSYDFPKVLMDRLHLDKIRIYLTGQNLFTFTKYSGFDPEVGSFGMDNTRMGYDFGSYPSVKTLIAGASINF
jgi:hypothetical protein